LRALVIPERSLAASAGDNCQQAMTRRRLDAVEARIYCVGFQRADAAWILLKDIWVFRPIMAMGRLKLSC
jgi:hypothetical protein